MSVVVVEGNCAGLRGPGYGGGGVSGEHSRGYCCCEAGLPGNLV